MQFQIVIFFYSEEDIRSSSFIDLNRISIDGNYTCNDTSLKYPRNIGYTNHKKMVNPYVSAEKYILLNTEYSSISVSIFTHQPNDNV